MAGVIDLLFGGGKSAPAAGLMAPTPPAMPNIAPTPVVAPPARSDAETQAAAEQQRRKYGRRWGSHHDQPDGRPWSAAGRYELRSLEPARGLTRGR